MVKEGSKWSKIELVTTKCATCNETFTTDSKLQHHKPCFQQSQYFLADESALRCKCRYCDKRFEHLDTLLRHVLFHLDEKEYVCNLCDERFHRKQGVTNHIARKHNETRNYPCKHQGCSKAFATLERMHQHHELIHENKVNRSQCHLCGRVYRQRRNMLQHMNSHHETSDAATILKRKKTS